jgi:hypothetical protein
MDFKHESNRIYLENEKGECIAEVTFPQVSENKVNINRTYVDNSLRGRGVADKLMSEVMDDLKKSNKKAVVTCSYAAGWLKTHPEYKDVCK